MPNLKIAHGAYLNEDALECVIDKYVFHKAIYYDALAVDKNHATEQMRMVKEVWNQTGGKQLHHFILNFSPWESSRITGIEGLKKLAYRVCEYYANEYQIVYGIHDNGHLHIHFVLNSVNYRTGEKFVHRNADDFILADLIKTLYIPNALGHPFPVTRIPVFYY